MKELIKLFKLGVILGILLLFSYQEVSADCQGCCSGHGGVVCQNGITKCADGTPLSDTCVNKGCNICLEPPSCDFSHLGLCNEQSSCEGAGGYWCYNSCESNSCPPIQVMPWLMLLLDDAPGKNSALIGGWFYNPGSLANSAVLTFIDDTNYMFVVDGEPDDGGGRGFERGTYTWDPSSGTFNAIAISATLGDWGITSLNDMTLNINGNTLNLIDSVEGLIPFEKISSATNPIIGSWLHNPGSLANSAVLTFIDDTNFMLATEEDPNEPGTGGMQRGTYTWNSSTGLFTVTVISETVQLYGISLANNTNVSVNNDTLILHDIQDGVLFTRIQ